MRPWLLTACLAVSCFTQTGCFTLAGAVLDAAVLGAVIDDDDDDDCCSRCHTHGCHGECTQVIVVHRDDHGHGRRRHR